MSKVLAEYFGDVASSDVHKYGFGEQKNFLKHPFDVGAYDWVVTNPPFRHAEDFILRGFEIGGRGVAILARTVFLESVGRYERLFSKNPPSVVAQFTERVPMVKGRLDKKASTATGYCWFVWDKVLGPGPQLKWIPPCRKDLERPTDYDPIPISPKPGPMNDDLFAK